MISQKTYYLCKNLLYWKGNDSTVYFCTFSSKKCECQCSELGCPNFEEDLEE